MSRAAIARYRVDLEMTPEVRKRIVDYLRANAQEIRLAADALAEAGKRRDAEQN